MLKQNTTIYAQYPFRLMGGIGAERTMWGQSERRNKYAGEAGWDKRCGTPSGHLHPSSWTLPQVAGGLSSFTKTVGSATLVGGGALGLNASAGLTGSGSISSATAQLVISMVANLTGSGTASNADLRGYLNAVANLTGGGSLAGAMAAIAWANAALSGDGDITSATPYATGELAATILSYGSLTPEGIRDAVWAANAAANNSSGSMGEKMNNAASAGDPWGTALPGSYPVGSAGAMLAALMNGLTPEQQDQLLDIWQRLGLDPLNPQITTATGIIAGGVDQTITETAGPTITVTRNP